MYINLHEIKRPRPAATDRRRIAGIARGDSAPTIHQITLRFKRRMGTVKTNIADEFTGVEDQILDTEAASTPDPEEKNGTRRTRPR